MEITSVAASEAAKTVVASLIGASIKGISRLLKLLRERLRGMPSDPAALAELIVRQAETDPGFAEEILQALAELGRGAGAVCPAPPERFADRDALRRQVASSDGAWLIAGQAGVGKTAFVRQVANDAAGRFPHGLVEIDLDRWRDGDTLRVSEIEAQVLGQLGVEDIEPAEPGLSQQYLRALLRRRFVLILDNAMGAAELRTLAQPWPRSLVLVTVRRLTDDLRIWAAPDRLVQLRGLDEAGAWQLLADRCGEAMLAAEPAATGQLLALCDRMPLPLLQVAVALARRRGEPGAVAAVLAQLRAGGPAGPMEQCLARAFEELAESTVAGLRALATHPGTDFTYRSAEVMLGPEGPRVVDELVDACLVEQERGRLRLPHPVRRYALGPAAGQDGMVHDGPQADRLLDFYRDTAVAADLHTTGGDWDGRLRRYPRPAGCSWQLPGVDPVDWLDIESATIGELVPEAFRRGRHRQVVQLCGALEVLLTYRGRHWRCAEAFDWGVRSAAALGDLPLQVRLHTMQGRVFTLLHVFDRAADELATAARLLSGLDDPRLAASVWEAHGRLHEELAAYQPAPDYRPAIDYLQRAARIDHAAGLARPLRVHRRMLANVLVKAARPEQARDTLESVTSSGEARNDARAQMVLAKAYTALGELPRARAAVAAARRLLAGTGADQYELELVEIEADIAWHAGDVAAARAGWGWIANRYCDGAHPRFALYLAKLDQLPPPPQ